MSEFMGKYADMREEFLKQSAPELYKELQKSGRLENELRFVQQAASLFVEERMNNPNGTFS